ncbi:unnamed protein product [Blepharisma stoltei]|uniref:Kelch motif family protein n=1 Tax=Blepharisma stoltei TaxID=1481888 RepID=A0AAU9JBG8_9CILI|nr:unnamed protein product [Blepharisma stoltei]
MPVISDSLISMCKIPDCGVFCYGDWPPSGKTLIITNDKLIMQLPTGRPCCNTKALMYKNSIYVFGGYKNRIEESEFASEFNLLTSNWKVLTSMPKPSTGVYSLPYDEEILLLGCNHDKLYSYNIQKNSYREVTAMVKGKRRVLFGIGKLVYVIESEGNILKSEGNLIEWSIIGSGSAFQPQISYIELYNESFYFMDQTCLLYQFKLSEERLRIVDLIEKEGENASTEFHYLTL